MASTADLLHVFRFLGVIYPVKYATETNAASIAWVEAINVHTLLSGESAAEDFSVEHFI